MPPAAQPVPPPPSRRKLHSAKRWILIALAVLVLGLGTAAATQIWMNRQRQQAISEETKFNDAKKMSIYGACDKASDSLKQLLGKGVADEAREAEARAILGECLIQQKQLDQAITELEKASALAKKRGDKAMQARVDYLLARAKTMKATQGAPSGPPQGAGQ